MSSGMPTPAVATPSRVRVAVAFAAVYIIWGSTYLAIRVGVETIPPLLMAGVRFVFAGSLLYAWARWRGAPRPMRTHWRSSLIVGGFLLLGGNGLVCWAEQLVPSGIAALLVTTVPLWLVLFNWLRRNGVRPRAVEVVGLILGFLGVVLLIDPRSIQGAATVDRVGAAALVLASCLWAIGSLYSRHTVLPASPLLSTAMQMLCGGALLLTTSLATGDAWKHPLTAITGRSLLALAYLVVFGALLGFTAYVYILKYSTPARVGTYAYVNPVIAVMLGWAVLSEPITWMTIAAMAVIVSGVVLITVTRTKAAQAAATPPAPQDPPNPDAAGRADGRIVSQASALFDRAAKSAGPVSADDGEVFALSELAAARQRSDRPYLEFLRAESLSAGLYALPAGGADTQRPHSEAEVYFVVRGRAKLSIGELDYDVRPGSVAYVRAEVEHRFHSIEEALEVLVFFAPAEYTRAREPEEAECTC